MSLLGSRATNSAHASADIALLQLPLLLHRISYTAQSVAQLRLALPAATSLIGVIVELNWEEQCHFA